MLRKQAPGFTLLELMISITILTLILAVIFGAMRLGSRSWEVGEKRIDRIQRMRITHDIISEDIRSILPTGSGRGSRYGTKPICPDGRGCSVKAVLFIGETDRIKFVTTNPGIDRSLNTSQYRVVTYFLGQEYHEEYQGVVMEEHAWLFPDFFRFEAICDKCESEENIFEFETFTHVIYPDVRELTFRYYGKRTGDAEPEWYETWNTFDDLCSCDSSAIQDALPQKIEVKMMRPKVMSQEEEDLEEIIFEVPIEGYAETS